MDLDGIYNREWANPDDIRHIDFQMHLDIFVFVASLLNVLHNSLIRNLRLGIIVEIADCKVWQGCNVPSVNQFEGAVKSIVSCRVYYNMFSRIGITLYTENV